MNPRAAAGRAGLRLDRLAAVLRSAGPFELRVTGSRGHATVLAREAIRAGAARILAVGGDGTINEVVNGFFDGAHRLPGETELAVLSLGTGGDFRRTFDLPATLEPALERILHGRARDIDVGRVTAATREGACTRHFANIASLGLSAAIAGRVNGAGWLKRHAGQAAFAWGAVAAILRARPVPVRITVDGTVAGEFPVFLCAVCNGRYFGGAMHVAPHARPDDGRLDVICVGGAGRGALLGALRDVFTGAHLQRDFVRTFQGRDILVEPLDTARVPVELDGETPGAFLPARFTVLPGAIRLRA